MSSPPLEHGDTPPPPPAEGEGDHLPERDWRVVGVLAFGFAFSLVAAMRFGAQLAAELGASL
jgi:hypothetical protein